MIQYDPGTRVDYNNRKGTVMLRTVGLHPNYTRVRFDDSKTTRPAGERVRTDMLIELKDQNA